MTGQTWGLVVAAAILLTAPGAQAQWEASDGSGDRRQRARPAKKVEGQILPTFYLGFSERARFELLPRDTFRALGPDEARDWRVANRARASIRLDMPLPEGNVYGMFELQDSRSWGAPPSTFEQGTQTWTANPGLTVRRAFARISHEDGFFLAVGRQRLHWTSRLVGENNFGNGRTFDAIRVGVQPGPATLDFFYSKRLEAPVDNSLDPRSVEEDLHLIGLRGGPRASGMVFDGVLLVEVDGSAATEGAVASFGVYGGGFLNNTFVYSLEIYGQAGTIGGEEHRAFMLGGVVGAQIPLGDLDGGIRLEGGLETISGGAGEDEDLDTFLIRQGDTFGQFGRMNRYTDIGVGTADQGLIDASFRLGLYPNLELDLNITFEAHVFRAQSPIDTDRAFHGGELDVGFHVAPVWNIEFRTEAWIYFPGPFWGDDRVNQFAMLAGLEVKIR